MTSIAGSNNNLVSKRIILSIGLFSFLYHSFAVYFPSNFVEIFDPTSFALKSEYFFNFIFPTEFLTSSFPSMTSGFYPPGFYIFYNMAYKIFGRHESVIRWVALLHQFAIPPLVYLISKRYVKADEFIAIAVSLMALFYSVGNVHYYPDYIVLFYSTLLMLTLLEYNACKKALFLYIAGILCGLIIFIKHNIGIQYFIASIFTLIVAEMCHDAAARNGKSSKSIVSLVAFLTLLFYIWFLRKAFVLNDIIFFLMPVALICGIIVFSLSKKFTLSQRDIIRNTFKFCLPIFIIIIPWLSIYFYYFGVKEYLYRLVFLGYTAFDMVYVDILDSFNIRIVTILIFFANLYLGCLDISNKKYFMFVGIFNLAVAISLVLVLKSFGIELKILLPDKNITILLNTVFYQCMYLSDLLYFSFFLNMLGATIIILKMIKNRLTSNAKVWIIILIFSVFALNSVYPSNDLFHAMMRLPMNLPLLGAVLCHVNGNTKGGRKNIFILFVGFIFMFAPVASKIKSVVNYNKKSIFNERMDVYLDNNIVAYLNKIDEIVRDHKGQEALIIDSDYVQQTFAYVFDLRPAVPYFDFDKRLVEKELPYEIIKMVKKNRTKLIILNEDDYKQVESGNYRNLNLIPLYKYIKEQYKLIKLIQSTPELEKQQLRGCAILTLK